MEIKVGSILEGTVKSITKFGAFITLPGGRSGLVHISEIAHSYVNEVSDHLSDGQEVRVKIVGIDEAGRINLSIKKAMDPPPSPPSQPARSGNGNSNFSRGQGQNQGRSFEPRSGQGAPPRSFSPRPAPARSAAPAAPAGSDFENMMKQFMQTSDNKLSSMKMHEKRSSRRGGGGGR